MSPNVILDILQWNQPSKAKAGVSSYKPALCFGRGRDYLSGGGFMLAKLGAYIQTILCEHDFELLAKLRMEGGLFERGGLCWIYRCKKCGYVQKVKS